MINRSLLTFLALCTLLITSCDTHRVFEDNKPIANSTWKQNHPILFDVAITDTIIPYNLYVNIRNSGNYQYSNLFLFVKMYFPNGQRTRDTVECTLAEPGGKWLGDGLGDIYDNQKLFKQAIKFPRKGVYKFEVEQAMRIDPLQGITDIGMRVERTQ